MRKHLGACVLVFSVVMVVIGCGQSRTCSPEVIEVLLERLYIWCQHALGMSFTFQGSVCSNFQVREVRGTAESGNTENNFLLEPLEYCSFQLFLGHCYLLLNLGECHFHHCRFFTCILLSLFGGY